MEDLPGDLRAFLQKHPCFQLTDSKKIKCTLNDHEFPCSLDELQHFTSGKKYKKLSAEVEFDYRQYEPHVVSSTKQPNHLFCKLTLRHINRVPRHVLRHVTGKRYRKALDQYEECVRQGVKFVPVQLRQKKRAAVCDEASGSDKRPTGSDKRATGSDKRATGSDKRASRKEDSGVWAPGSSDVEDSDSEDSLSDLYPPSLFIKKEEEEQNMKEEEDFETDDDDEEDEVSEMEVENQTQKRKKLPPPGSTKRFKKNRKKNGFKHVGKVNGK
ncbi:surfeit locus protein 2 [Rhinichthys klamathensis goyatoka]|uniref:surfeit locus protein 2 n=1 Tax=Rhinichthys klamathensis goyatoka TaxID=3034132 RepID=UPI0024B57909|nr:surfeit locus protein 2 [Rhinichthys klamathensis goyatoka]